MTDRPTSTIVFVTGAFMHNSCWNEWQSFFEQRGYTTFAPAWPHKNATAEELRNCQPSAEIASNRLTDLVEYYAAFVKALPEKPILIGHSIGGLFVQLLLQRELAVLGVAIHSVPPQGIFSFSLAFLRAGWGPLGFFTSARKSFLMSFSQWQFAITNGMDSDLQKDAYYKYALPESKMLVRDTITSAAKIDFRRSRVPLLLTSGNLDHSIPAILNRKNFEAYKNGDSVTDYREFSGRNHFVLAQAGWKEVADYVLVWINRHNNALAV